MTTLDYNVFMRQSLQRMVGDVLQEVAENGLPGDHHFYISFLTQDKAVDIPSHLRLQHPEEMTIVMQEWFDDLGVMDDRFCVTLSFGGKAEALVIPFAAITGFADPSANFNLRFDANADEVKDAQGAVDDSKNDTEKSSLGKNSSNKNATGAKEPSEGDAQVIQLDKFRKEK